MRPLLRGLYWVEGSLQADRISVDTTRLCRLGWRPGAEHLPIPEGSFRPYPRERSAVRAEP